jgi:hypothetical protein
VFLGGAGMNSAYQDDMKKALEENGIENVVIGNYSAIFRGMGIDSKISEFVKKYEIPFLPNEEIDMGIDAAFGVLFYNQDPNDTVALQFVDIRGCIVDRKIKFGLLGAAEYIHTSGKTIKGKSCQDVIKINIPPFLESEFTLKNIGVNKKVPTQGQFNLIGYSWGAVIAARTALYYAERGTKVDHLILIGAPINYTLLEAVNTSKNIKDTIVINLTDHGDPIEAGMDDMEIIKSAYKLIVQMANSNGHFYYGGDNDEGKKRRRDLAKALYNAGLR